MENLLFSDWDDYVEVRNEYSTTSTLDYSLSLHEQRIRKFDNRHLLEGIPREGPFDMPKSNPVYIDNIPNSFVPFNCLKGCSTTNVGVHFFIYDYQFQRVWGNMENTLKRLSKYKLVLSTDDSVFLDCPLSDNMRNQFKSRTFTAVGQRNGINVVPTFSCGDPIDLERYCDGLPNGGCIAVGGMGTNKTRSQQIIFRYCVREMVNIKHPDMLLIYGSKIDLGLDIPVIRIPAFVDKFKMIKYEKK